MKHTLFSDGFIHTMELRIYPRKGIDIQQDFIDKKHPKRVARGHSGVNQDQGKEPASAILRFNPNRG